MRGSFMKRYRLTLLFFAAWRRYVLIGLILLLGVALSLASFAALRSLEGERTESELSEQAAARVAAIARTADGAVEVAQSIRGLFDASREVERHEFKAFTKSALVAHPEIQALYWLPRVPLESRLALVEAARRDGFVDFDIRDMDPDGQLAAAGAREEYFPVLFAEPPEAGERVLGLDLASEAVRRRAMEQARDTGEPVLTGPIRMAPETGTESGVLVFVPVWAKGHAVGTVQERRAHLEGFAVGTFSVGKLVEHALRGGVVPTMMDFTIYDATDPAAVLLMYSFSPDRGPGLETVASEPASSSRSDLQLSATVDIAGRQWVAVFRPGAGFPGGNPWLPWASLAGGLLLTGIGTSYVYGLASQTAQVQRLIAQRTSELETATGQIKERNAQLEVLNKELEAFSFSVSHDLRAPLRGIDGFCQALLEDYEDKLDDQGKDYLQRVRLATQRMGQLIDDMLRLSRVMRNEMRSETVDLSGLVRSLGLELQKTQPARRVQFVVADGLTAKGDLAMLRVALENLLGNAWKFTGKNPQAKIEFGFEQHDGHAAYFVRDDGVGFDMAYADKLFGAFQRLHSPTEFPGTGVGLATVQRIIHRHGGRIWAEAEVDKGAAFYFTLQNERS